MSRKLVLVVGLIAVAALGYGYWHAVSHGSLYISVVDVSDHERQRPVLDAELWFLGATGNVLARADAAAPSGAYYIAQPGSYACREFEERAPFSREAREAWDRCFERQSRWLVTWVRDVKYVDLKSGACWLRKMPVSVSERGEDWWLWWVPLRHVGGKPYTSFLVYITFDRNRCAMRSG